MLNAQITTTLTAVLPLSINAKRHPDNPSTDGGAIVVRVVDPDGDPFLLTCDSQEAQALIDAGPTGLEMVLDGAPVPARSGRSHYVQTANGRLAYFGDASGIQTFDSVEAALASVSVVGKSVKSDDAGDEEVPS